MHVLILNWRDIRSPRAGGAERITHEVARGLVVRGHRVTWLSSSVDGAPANDEVDGVRIVRRGSEVTTRMHARSFARDVRPDVVIEEINTLPYLAPLWSSVPVLLYMNQLAREVWWYEAALPLAAVGWLAEPIYLKAYRRCDIVTISASSRDDLRALGMRGRIVVAPMAVHAPVVDYPPRKCLRGSLVTVGRLTPSKRIDHAVEALRILRLTHPEAKLQIIGEGRDLQRLTANAREKGVESHVQFHGRLSEQEKVSVIDEADFLVGTSVREGWGLTVTEAAARGTPAIVYNIAGFRDAVIHARTGLVVPSRADALASAAARLLRDRPRYERMQYAALQSARTLSYGVTTDVFEEATEYVMRRASRRL